MKKQIAVIASLFVASTAISANAATFKDSRISISDILESVKNNNSENTQTVTNDDSCRIPEIIGGLIGHSGSIKDFIFEILENRFPLPGNPGDSEEPENPNDSEEMPEEKPEEKPETDPDDDDCFDDDCDDNESDDNESDDNESDPDVPETPEIPDIPEIPENPDIPSGGENDGNNNNKPGYDDSFESADAYVNEVLRLVNKYRNENGLSSVSLSSAICDAADVRAVEIKSVFSHTRPDGRSCFTALSDLGISYGGAGENIAYGQSSPEEVMTAWMNSSGHRANILNSSFTKLGVGVYKSGNTIYWVQLFTY